MNKKINLPGLIKINKKNISTEAGTITLKYINPTDETKDTLREKLSNAPHLTELMKLLDDKIHNRIIIECEDLNFGISAVGQIGNCMNGFINKSSVMEFEVDFDDDDFFFDDEEKPIIKSAENNIKDNFVLIYESEFDSECNNVSDSPMSEMLMAKTPKINYSDFKNIIFVADGLFTLTDNSVNFLQGITGNIAIVINFNNKNETAIRQLVFESDFETVQIKKPKKHFLVEQFKSLAKEKGLSIAKNVNIEPKIDELIRYRGNKFQEYDLSIYLDKNIQVLENSKTIKKLISMANTHSSNSTDLLKDIIGLDDIKESIYQELYKYLHKIQMSEKGHEFMQGYNHMAFQGNPGTCKTTMARAVAKLYQENNIIANGFYEFGREDLVGKYLGETSQKVSKIFRMGKGGLIFIDEFGAIVSDSSDSYGIEALNGIVRHMENNPDTIVIVATYPEELEKILSINPGLRSRLSKIISFPDYCNDNLLNIFKHLAEKGGYILEDEYENIVLNYFNKIRKSNTFANGREVRKLFECAIAHLSVELFKNKSKQINFLTVSSIENAVSELLKDSCSSNKVRIGFSVK